MPGQPPLLVDVSLRLRAGSTCLLLGGNGAGKTTLLKILGGKHMVPEVCSLPSRDMLAQCLQQQLRQTHYL